VEPPQDLSGELQLRHAGGDDGEQDTVDTPPAAVAIDRKKAEALLGNIKEDRTRFLRLQIPEEKRGEAFSGKTW
jgi:hypothetical protein